MTHKAFSFDGIGESIRFVVGRCSLGSILVAASRRGICAIFLGDEPRVLVREIQNLFPKAQPFGEHREIEDLLSNISGFVDSPSLGLDLPLDVRGTPFQQRVWRALRGIPSGSTVSYAEIAERIGVPNGAFAVGQACASNLIAVAIPCHRVVRKNGALAGYRWGLARKRALLDREARL